MRKIDRQKNMLRANLLIENIYLNNKNNNKEIIEEGFKENILLSLALLANIGLSSAQKQAAMSALDQKDIVQKIEQTIQNDKILDTLTNNDQLKDTIIKNKENIIKNIENIKKSDIEIVKISVSSELPIGPNVSDAALIFKISNELKNKITNIKVQDFTKLGNKGQFYVTPDSNGIVKVIVTFTDTLGNTNEKSFDINVKEKTTNYFLIKGIGEDIKNLKQFSGGKTKYEINVKQLDGINGINARPMNDKSLIVIKSNNNLEFELSNQNLSDESIIKKEGIYYLYVDGDMPETINIQDESGGILAITFGTKAASGNINLPDDLENGKTYYFEVN